MKPKITLLKTVLAHRGGAEKYTRQLAEAFSAKNCSVKVLTTGPILANSYPFEVVSFPLKSKTSVGRLWEFDRLCTSYIKEHPTDIIFGCERNRFQTHLRAGSGVHKAYLEHRSRFEPKWLRFRHACNPLHLSILHKEKQGFEHPRLRTLFVNSHLVKKEILTHYRVDENKITVIHNGVEWLQWQENFNEWPAHHNPSHFTFLFAGSNFQRKGLERILRGLALLSQRNFTLLVAGYDKNQKKFEQLAEQLGLSNNILFLGLQSNITSLYQKADCLVIPSFYDPFANVTTEALAMGVYVVSSKTNGGAEILTQETGCIIENLYDDESVKHALEIALNHPKSKDSALKIRKSVESLDFSKQLEQYLEKTLCESN